MHSMLYVYSIEYTQHDCIYVDRPSIAVVRLRTGYPCVYVVLRIYDKAALDVVSLPITPHAARPPALPVLRDSSLSPLPRSSVPWRSSHYGHGDKTNATEEATVWTTTARLDLRQLHDLNQKSPRTHPRMLCGPLRERTLSWMLIFATPLLSVAMFPKSPTWRALSVGAPCVCSNGLKCEPAETQPLLRSPSALSVVSGQFHGCIK
jgi:hypothetical protein